MCFIMQPGKEGRVKYLLMTMLPPAALYRILLKLADAGFLSQGERAGTVYGVVCLVAVCILGYFLVLKKNHTIEFSDIAITERDFRGSCRLLSAGKVHSWRRNSLNEILLMDENGKKLLCVESNMENRSQFEKWLDSHHINEYAEGVTK